MKFTVSPSQPHLAVITQRLLFLCWFLCINLHYIIHSIFRVGLHRQAFATSNKRSKSFSLNVSLPEVFRVCIIAHVIPQKIYVLFKYIYFLSLNLQGAEREHLSYHRRQSTKVPHLRLQERYPIDQAYIELTLFSIGSEIGSSLAGPLCD